MKPLTKSRELYKEYKNYVLQVTPFRTPILDHGKGNIIWDVDGNNYLDMMSGQFCLAFGHSYGPLNRVIAKQITKLTHTNTLTLSSEVFEAAKELASLTKNSLKKTILLSTGAEAVECALRYAKFYTKREGIVGISSGYHGLTLATQSISTGGIYAHPRIPQSYDIPSPDWLTRPEGVSIDAYLREVLIKSREALEPHRGTIAAFVIEPVISVGGMIYPPATYFQAIKQLAEEHGALLIFDECQTGLGRTGEWFGYQHYNVVPDILVLAKIAGSGLPVSAVMMDTKIAEAVEGKFIHFSSHQNDPLSGAIVSFVIKHMKKKESLKHIRSQGAYLLSKLRALSKTEPWLEHPRGLGLMIGFDLPARLFENGKNPGTMLINLLEEQGIIAQVIKRGATVRILPSYLIKRTEINRFIDALSAAFKALHSAYETA